MAERDYSKRVAAERAAGEEKKRLARRDEHAEKAEDFRKSQTEAARVLME